MKTLRNIMICLNLLVGFLVASGVFGYVVAYDPQRKESWLFTAAF